MAQTILITGASRGFGRIWAEAFTTGRRRHRHEAKNLLVGSDNAIAETAYRPGFENPPYFSRLFKRSRIKSE